LTTLSDSDPRGSHGFAYVSRNDERVFRAAVRHSRHVRFLRLAIPASIVAAVLGAIGGWLVIKPLSMLAKLPIDLSSLVVSGSKIMMQQPRVAGFTRDNRRYAFVAQAAGQDLTKPDLVELHGIRATMEMKDHDQFETTAQDGIYNGKTELLTLSQNIVVTSSSGYRALLSEAVIDVKGGTIVSEQPVHVTSAAWTVDANRMEIGESGDLMRFERGVSVVLKPQQPAPTAEARSR
jgi:lipopolysaccharide export system protein LptC